MLRLDRIIAPIAWRTVKQFHPYSGLFSKQLAYRCTQPIWGWSKKSFQSQSQQQKDSEDLFGSISSNSSSTQEPQLKLDKENLKSASSSSTFSINDMQDLISKADAPKIDQSSNNLKFVLAYQNTEIEQLKKEQLELLEIQRKQQDQQSTTYSSQ